MGWNRYFQHWIDANELGKVAEVEDVNDFLSVKIYQVRRNSLYA